jgi:type IX secretion system PorP/SprF family membrane protein
MQGILHILGKLSKYTVLVWLSISAFGQQAPGLSLSHLNSLYFNPAAAGVGRDAYIQNHYRNQWTSYETSQDGSGNLGTNIVGLSIPLDFQNLGMGLIVMSDKTPSGVGQQVVRLQMAYHLPLASGAQVSFGLGFGMQSKSFDGQIFRVRDVNDPLAEELSGKQVSQSLPDFNAGVLYTTDLLEVGLGLGHLNQSAYDFGIPKLRLVNDLVLNLHAKGTIGLNERFDLTPFGQLNYYNGVILPQGGAKVTFQQQFWVGAGYRWDDASIFMTGISLLNNRLDVAYALDLSLVNTAAKSTLSHEIMLRFVLPSFQLATRNIPVKTPRFK